MTDALIRDAAHYQDRLGLSFAPSPYQAAIFQWIEAGRGHAVVRAVAGSGKTTTIVLGARLVSGSGLFLAFNKPIAVTLGERLQGTSMRASTVHSHAYACLRFNARRSKLNKYKYGEMVARAAEKAVGSQSLRGYRFTAEQVQAIKADGFPTEACERLIDLARLSLLDLDADRRDFHDKVMALADRHDIAFDGALDWIVTIVVHNCLCLGADDMSQHDFTDMLWQPVVNGWRPLQYHWIFVDECQDISRCALEMIRRSLKPGGRLMFVGDDRQAIYGFAGADSESFDRIIRECEAQVLPLSVCYRCPTSHLDIAREWCSAIEARDDAPEGDILSMSKGEYAQSAIEGDLVICRRNAPLVGLCFELIAAGMPASVRGRSDIGEGLIKLARKVGKRWDRFAERLAHWEKRQIEISTARSRDPDRLAARIEQIQDQAEALRIIAARAEAKSSDDCARAIEGIFSDDRASVVLSSIHKAKGLEAERVAVLEADKLPYKARQEWQRRQEENLAYVAFTRAKRTLIQIVTPKRGAES